MPRRKKKRKKENTVSYLKNKFIPIIGQNTKCKYSNVRNKEI